MMDVGLDYLTLDRKAGTLSGGEAQRIRLGVADRLAARRHALYFGRADNRSPSAGQRQIDRDPAQSARFGEYDHRR